MAAPGGRYFIQDQLGQKAAHHESFQQLWETKWKQPCSMGVYPFMFGAIQDFEPIVHQLIEDGHREPYNWDAYAETFFPKARELEQRACEAESQGHRDEASELFLRASAVYRISRFPFPRSANQHHAWTEGKRNCLRGLSLHAYPMTEIDIPHSHGLASEGKSIPVYAHIPPTATPSAPAPCAILLTGLDGYRTELAAWSAGFGALGVGTLVFEIPGTGDSPADPRDPTSGDRVFSSLFSWLRSAAAPPLDPERLVVWGFSTGGYHVIRAAHTHSLAAAGFIAQGGGCHHMFDPEWLDASNSLEYPFDLGSTLACKFGYHGDKGFAAFKKEARSRFSLLENGTLDRPCGRLLLVNGTGDEIFPIDDYYLVLTRGGPKEARFVDSRKHMGEPEAFFIILQWIYDRLGIRAVPLEQMKTMPFKPKYPQNLAHIG